MAKYTKAQLQNMAKQVLAERRAGSDKYASLLAILFFRTTEDPRKILATIEGYVRGEFHSGETYYDT